MYGWNVFHHRADLSQQNCPSEKKKQDFKWTNYYHNQHTFKHVYSDARLLRCRLENRKLYSYLQCIAAALTYQDKWAFLVINNLGRLIWEDRVDWNYGPVCVPQTRQIMYNPRTKKGVPKFQTCMVYISCWSIKTKSLNYWLYSYRDQLTT